MLRMSFQVENIVSAYKQLSKIPTLVGARLTKGGKNVSSQWSVRNLDRGKTTKFAYNYYLDSELNVTGESEFGTDISNELLSAVSPSESLRAVIREHGDTKESRKLYLEVWRARTLAHSIDLNALDLHGEVYADSEFKSLVWSPDENSILYIAEKKLTKSEPYIKRKPAKDEAKTNSTDTPVVQGEEYVYRQDWGEQLVGKHLSVVAVCRLDTETVSVLPGLPDHCCPGQVRWSPDGEGVVGVAWETEPRRLGLIFCTNRPSYIFTLTLDGHFRKISSDGQAVRSPRFVGANKLVWLQRTTGGPHHACHQIVYTAWPPADEPKISVALDIVATGVKTSNDVTFHGVYSQALPTRCSTADGRLVFSTQQRRTVRSYVLSLETGKLVDISDSSSPGCTSILDVHNDIILASRTSMTNPTQLIAGKLPEAGSERDIFWLPISARVELPDVLRSSLIEYLDLQHDNSSDTVSKFSAIYFAPAAGEGERLPLVVWPHGGPHSAFVDSYSLEAALFVMMGFAVLKINFRGSTGQGDDCVRSLLGHIGEYDVQDCLLAISQVRANYPVYPDANCFLFGKSYGGFVVTQLSGRHPEMFGAVVARCPLLDLAVKAHYADNTESCAVEAGYEFSEAGAVSEEQLVAMRRASPLAHAHRVRAPTALMLGSVDKRVPYYQGLEYHRRLKANGCVTKLYLYEDNHSLSTPPVEMDNLINSVLWFLKHTQ